jgi:tetratricopeptide (TPR) repeat protein
MTVRSVWLAATAVALLVADASIAGAQAKDKPPASHGQKRPTRKELDAARAHFKAAEAAKERRDYRAAASEYLAAYELFADPEFFFNVAEVYRLAGDEQEAISYYEKYLVLDPNGRGAASARASADELRRAIAARQEAAKRAANEEARRKADAEVARAAEKAAQVKAAQAAEAQRREAAGRNLRIAGIATGGAGAVALGVGVYFGLEARSISDEVSSAPAYDASRDNEGKAANRNMVIFTAVGGAAVVAGGVLYYLGHRARRSAGAEATVTVAPSVGGSQISIMAQGRF